LWIPHKWHFPYYHHFLLHHPILRHHHHLTNRHWAKDLRNILCNILSAVFCT
jgi:hypothetical protein